MTNTPPLSWISTEVERALGVVHEGLARLSSGADAKASLEACPAHLRQASGALRMAGLGGAAAVCEVIEAGYAKLGPRPEAANIAAVDRAVVALKAFVADLARGQADCVMRLLPMYREVAQLAGKADASEKDLFYPDPSVAAPPHRRPKLLPEATVEAFVKKQRAVFQRGLLGWLRDSPTGLEEMRRAVNQLHKIGAQLPAPQAIWWVANGMLDALAGSESAGWVAAAKAIGTRLERQMGSGLPVANDSLLRDLLYAVARCQTVSPRIRQIRDLYRLDAVFPEKRVMRDHVDEQLLPMFLEEAQDIVPHIGSDLRDWKADPADEQASGSLRRLLHTLKGSARMTGAIRLGELCHLMETRIDQAFEAQQFPAEMFDFLQERMDRISADVERMSVPAMLRMSAETLGRLIDEADQLAIARSRVEAELCSLKRRLGELNECIVRLREVEVPGGSQAQLTRLQELTHLMAASLADADGALAEQARITLDVQHALMRVRAVPFSNLSERLHRVVRQTARELGKKAELEIRGGGVELDRGVLERIGAPLEHMLRNALAHGIESPEARVAAGKGDTGTVSISLRQHSNEIALTLSDDGAGFDLERLRQRGLERGLLPSFPGDARPATEAEIAELVFHSGLSTAREVSELAGRGVGMDVVRNEISAVGGRIDIQTTRGQGATFTVHLPIVLAATNGGRSDGHATHRTPDPRCDDRDRWEGDRPGRQAAPQPLGKKAMADALVDGQDDCRDDRDHHG